MISSMKRLEHENIILMYGGHLKDINAQKRAGQRKRGVSFIINYIQLYMIRTVSFNKIIIDNDMIIHKIKCGSCYCEPKRND